MIRSSNGARISIFSIQFCRIVEWSIRGKLSN